MTSIRVIYFANDLTWVAEVKLPILDRLQEMAGKEKEEGDGKRVIKHVK